MNCGVDTTAGAEGIFAISIVSWGGCCRAIATTNKAVTPAMAAHDVGRPIQDESRSKTPGASGCSNPINCWREAGSLRKSCKICSSASASNKA